jgi:hypothetical protein
MPFPSFSKRRPARHAAGLPARALATALRRSVAFLVLGLAACATQSPPLSRLAVVQDHAAGAYRPARTGTAPLDRRILHLEEAGIPGAVTVTLAPGVSPRPLVVLLPALGEDGEGARGWTEALAGAGYAVLCLQPLAEDALAWQTERARSGDFASIARERFARRLLGERIDALSRVLARLRILLEAGEPAPKGLRGALDWEHLSFVGLDLGAYTVQGIAAGMGPGLPPARALVALSPFGSTGTDGPLPSARHAPILFASSFNDIDPYGLVAGPAPRHRAFDSLGEGSSAYLELADASHGLLLGEAILEPTLVLPEQPHAKDAGDPQAGRKGGQRKDSGSGRGRLGDLEGPGEEGLESLSTRADRARSRYADARAAAAERINARTTLVSVVLAELDGEVLGLDGAKKWLFGGTAGSWIGGKSRWKFKNISEN